MNRKLLPLLLVIIAAFFIMVFWTDGSAGQTAQWKGKIEIVDGVKVVHNPREPLYGDIKLDLVEDLKIGGGDDPNYLFYRVRGIDVDKDGNIYVADMSNFRVQKFDKNGKYLLTFGRQGQGPGEFDQPTIVHVEEKSGNIYVLDRSLTIEIFTPDGKPARSIRSERVIFSFKVTNEGTIIALISAGSNMTPIHRLSKIGRDDKSTQNYIEVPCTPSTLHKDGRTLPIYTGHELDLQFDLMNERFLVFGYSKEYELTIADLAGKVVNRIRKDGPYPKFTAKEKEKKIFKLIPLPEFKPYFYTIYTDEMDRIYVQRNKTMQEEGNFQKEIEVFSRDGYFLYRTKLPKYTHVIRNGYLYALEVNDDEIVKRFKIKNWAALKTGL